jgi:uncharacterized membrane protein YdbT with pleckstrin-like domain
MEEIIPHHKYFASQKDDEDVLMIVRRHWIVYMPAFIIASFLLVVSFLLYINFDNISIIQGSYFMRGLSTALISLVVLFVILFTYVVWLINYLNFQLITNQHLVDIDQYGIFSRKISELTLEDIQDISATQHGFFQSIFHYGDVVVQTAGEKPNFTLEKVKEPYEISRQIMEIKGKYGEDTVKIVGSEEVSKAVEE